VRLEIKPTVHKIYFVPNEKLARLVDFTYKALRPKLGDEWFILDSCMLATIIADEPGKIEELASKQAPWTLVYGVSGFEYLPEERVAFQERDLAGIAQLAGVEAVPEIPGCSWKKMENILASPSPEPYLKTVPKGAFTDIFFLTTLDKAEDLIEVMRNTCKKHKYNTDELGVYIQPIQHGRTIHLEFTIYYNPEEKEDTNKARALFEEASVALDKAGAFFSRPYGPWAELAYARCPDTVAVLRKIKDMLDPDHVLNRGKLCFTEEVV
jgi:glycolate oxidase